MSLGHDCDSGADGSDSPAQGGQPTPAASRRSAPHKPIDDRNNQGSFGSSPEMGDDGRSGRRSVVGCLTRGLGATRAAPRHRAEHARAQNLLLTTRPRPGSGPLLSRHVRSGACVVVLGAGRCCLPLPLARVGLEPVRAFSPFDNDRRSCDGPSGGLRARPACSGLPSAAAVSPGPRARACDTRGTGVSQRSSG